ncbi:MAG: TonB-dependent receptor plug domain-containing protein, partial [Holophagales bacterium]|nr:TonB-dependent receptor plug domain-containing protein [Holophagales bacterium]
MFQMSERMEASPNLRSALFLFVVCALLFAPLVAFADDNSTARGGAAETAADDRAQTPEEAEQDSPADEAEDVATDEVVTDEIVVVGKYLYNDQVNALRTPTPILDVSQSLSIATADQFAEQGFTSIGEIISYTPGVNTSQGEGHRDAIVFRGVRSTADFFIDGVRDDVQYYRPLYNLEQVEILRGPNALFFGRG